MASFQPARFSISFRLMALHSLLFNQHYCLHSLPIKPFRFMRKNQETYAFPLQSLNPLLRKLSKLLSKLSKYILTLNILTLKLP